jgi:hypothetical protein
MSCRRGTERSEAGWFPSEELEACGFGTTPRGGGGGAGPPPTLGIMAPPPCPSPGISAFTRVFDALCGGGDAVAPLRVSSAGKF